MKLVTEVLQSDIISLPVSWHGVRRRHLGHLIMDTTSVHQDSISCESHGQGHPCQETLEMEYMFAMDVFISLSSKFMLVICLCNVW